jgi:hypothetical protein
MDSRSDRVKTWRKTTKLRIIESMGGKCVCCGYNKYHGALDLHHAGNNKEFRLGEIMAHPIAWEKIVIELRKCVLVCSNCHREIHGKIISLPLAYPVFDESFFKYREKRKDKTFCIVCGKEKKYTNKTCSYTCAAKLARKMDWESFDLADRIEKGESISQIADFLDLSYSSVRKRAKKMHLI